LKALNKIDKPDYLRLTKLIQDVYLDDLKLVPYFKEISEKKNRPFYPEEFVPLISLGLIYQHPSEQTPIERLEQSHESAPEFKGGEIEFNYLTSILLLLVSRTSALPSTRFRNEFGMTLLT